MDRPPEGKPGSVEPGQQKIPIIMDSVIVIAIELCCHTLSPESKDLVTLPAPLGFVNRCHHKRGRLESQRQPVTSKVPVIVAHGRHPCACLLQPQTHWPGLSNQPSPLLPLGWAGGLSCSSLFSSWGSMCFPGLSLPGLCLSHWLLQRAVVEAIATGSVQCPLGQMEHMRWLLALEGI